MVGAIVDALGEVDSSGGGSFATATAAFTDTTAAGATVGVSLEEESVASGTALASDRFNSGGLSKFAVFFFFCPKACEKETVYEG